MASTATASRPSDERRKKLSDELSVPLVSNFFPIERYLDAADKVHDSFQQAVLSNNLDNAYVYGKRYCIFVSDAIPTHNYYESPKYRPTVNKHKLQFQQVLYKLELVVQLMDREEEERRRQEEEAKERHRQQKYKEWQERIAKQKQSTPIDEKSIQASALSKLDLLLPPSQRKNGAVKQLPADDRSIRRDPSGEEPSGASSRYRIMDDSSDDEGGLPPPVLPPEAGQPPPPSYQQIQSHRTFLGPSPEKVPAVQPPSYQEIKAKKQIKLKMRELQEKYRKDYCSYQERGKIQIQSLGTYQGRVDASTNGCTVISALCAARHLRVNVISNDDIMQIIDRQCGPILRQIRSKLGLMGSALIIPSDVHDHLVDAKILRQDDFEGVAGGNIMDQNHIGEFVKLMSVGDDGKGVYRKAAATLFFREHVISIVKIPDAPKKQVQYDLIDSLPSNLSNGRLGATRTRCADVESLVVLLRWYASRKFSESNCTYIDRNKWDDSMADFDPRVFQGFVWMVDRQ